MPSSFAWTLGSTPFVLSPFTYPAFVLAGGVGGVCNGVAHDQGYFLALYDRILDDNYLAPLKVNANAGYEIYQGFSALYTRVSTAIERLECGSFIIFAEGGALATATVEFYRDDLSGGAVTVLAGSVVTTSRGGRDFVTLEAAVFGAFTDKVAVAAQAVAPGWEWNVTGARLTGGGEDLAGEIDTCKVLYESPPYGDPTIKVRQFVDAAGGQAPMLDGLGADRGVLRNPREPDDAYRVRIRALPDTVTPAAVRRAAAALLAPYGLVAALVEQWRPEFQTCWDMPSPNANTPTFDATAAAACGPELCNLFTLDDPRPAYDEDATLPFRNRWLDEAEMRGSFVVVVPALGPLEDHGMAFDDPAMTAADLVTPALAALGGRRAVPAFDVPGTLDAALLQGCYDGDDAALADVYAQLWAMLQRIKLAGVAAIIELRGQ